MAYPWNREFYFVLCLYRASTASSTTIYRYSRANTVTAAEDECRKFLRDHFPSWNITAVEQLTAYEYRILREKRENVEVDA